MRKFGTRRGLAGLALCAALLGAACGEEEKKSLKVVHVGGELTVDTRWTAGNLYVIDENVLVSATLTIAPGTIVKFSPGTSLRVLTDGAVIADGGSASTPIWFTSLADDARGGDTNGDGAGSAPAPGDWDGIVVDESGSIFNHCRLQYGGGNAPYFGALFVGSDAAVTVTHSTFARNQGGAPDDLRAAALNAGAAGVGTVITGNLFYGNDVPLVIGRAYDLDDSNTFEAVAGGVTVRNAWNGIFFGGPFAQDGAFTWSARKVPFVFVEGFGIPDGSTHTVGDGVILKFGASGGIDVLGALVAQGTDGIVFTSYLDDSVGGDTDGTGLSPFPGDWLGINVYGDGSVFDHCRISYAGGNDPYWGALTVSGTQATITNSTFAFNAGGDPDDARAAAVNLGGGAGTILTGNTFYGNGVPLVISGDQDLDDSNVFHHDDGVTTWANTFNGIFLDYVSYTVSGSTTWAETEVPFAVLCGWLAGGALNIDPAGTLTLGDGVAIKFDTCGAYVGGGLVQGAGNVFTSWVDDTVKGDSNGDGAASSPADGDWDGINLCNAGCTWATWGNIYFDAPHP